MQKITWKIKHSILPISFPKHSSNALATKFEHKSPTCHYPSTYFPMWKSSHSSIPFRLSKIMCQTNVLWWNKHSMMSLLIFISLEKDMHYEEHIHKHVWTSINLTRKHIMMISHFNFQFSIYPISIGKMRIT